MTQRRFGFADNVRPTVGPRRAGDEQVGPNVINSPICEFVKAGVCNKHLPFRFLRLDFKVVDPVTKLDMSKPYQNLNELILKLYVLNNLT